MTRIKVSLLVVLLLLTALWLAADTLLPEPFTYLGSEVQWNGKPG